MNSEPHKRIRNDRDHAAYLAATATDYKARLRTGTLTMSEIDWAIDAMPIQANLILAQSNLITELEVKLLQKDLEISELRNEPIK
jgi:hypothetical protein